MFFHKLLAVVCLVSLAIPVHSMILPPNDMYVPMIDSREFRDKKDEIERELDRVLNIYQPIVGSHKAKLSLSLQWKSGTVNAYASQSGSSWSVTMLGGLMNHPVMDTDAVALVFCHELGHHLGGFPFYTMNKWAAVEGQSDYYATLFCARKIWGNELEKNKAHEASINPVARLMCDAVHVKVEDRFLCYRVSNASLKLATLLAGSGAKPNYDTPDNSQVSKTNERHPRAQCRLDTYMAGALCAVNFDAYKIPGKNHPSGHNSLDAEKEAAQFACLQSAGYNAGYRPNCWFKSNL